MSVTTGFKLFHSPELDLVSKVTTFVERVGVNKSLFLYSSSILVAIIEPTQELY
jgi:hypothetical protein